MTDRIRPLMRVIIGLGVLIWLLVSVDVDRLLEVMGRAEALWLVTGGTLCLLAPLPAAARLLILMRRALAFWPALRITLCSYFFNQLFPAGVGGDVYRATRLKPLAGTWPTTIGLLTFERVIGILTLLLPAVLVAATQQTPRPLLRALADDVHYRPALVAALVAFFAAAVLAARVSGRIRALTAGLMRAVREISMHQIAGVLALSAIFHAVRISGMGALLRAFGSDVPVAALLPVMALALTATFVPLSVGALGVQEGVLVYALAAVGVPPAEGLAAALVNRGALVLLGVTGAFLLRGQNEISTETGRSRREREPQRRSLAALTRFGKRP